MLDIMAKTINYDVAAERDEEQQRGARQRRAQPVDRLQLGYTIDRLEAKFLSTPAQLPCGRMSRIAH
jgi:hypothetical protein